MQFSRAEIANFRSRPDKNQMIALLEERTEKLLSHDISDIPQKGIANWSHYYFCPDCSVPLVFDENERHAHECPYCKKKYEGEPFDGAWYGLLNDFYAHGVYHLALLYLLTESESYARKGISILRAYAKYYPSYEAHGNIPYNNQGKAYAQTLDESVFLKNLAFAFDILQETMNEDERNLIKENLLREGIEFLKQNRMNQIHNHEVITNSSIGILALILEDQGSLEFALTGKYGLLYQLGNGVLEDGFWFECSTAYHFYALEAFFDYERFALHSNHSNIDNPIFRKMFDVVFHYLREDISFTRLNDTKYEQGQVGAYEIFEFAYRVLKDERILALLHKAYEKKPRLSIESFFYGVEVLPPETKPFRFEDYFSHGGLGCSVLRGKNHEFLLLRHGQYGGEHDHYDRLALSYNYLDEGIVEDFGTCGYGAPFHYSYFKNTGTHNTVAIDEENQAPSAGKLVSVKKTMEETDITVSTTWNAGYIMPDSLTIKEWSEEAYLGVTMQRRIIKSGHYFIDIFTVNNCNPGLSIDFCMHFNGKLVKMPSSTPSAGIFKKKPLNLLRDIRHLREDLDNVCIFETSRTESRYYGMNNGNSVYLATGYDNPTTKDCTFYVERAYGPKACFVHLLSTHAKGELGVDAVKFERNGNALSISVTLNGRVRVHEIEL